MPIKNYHKIEQPRERLVKYGPGKLSDEELLAIVLRTGPRGSSVIELSKRVLREFTEARLAQASVSDLVKVKGIGEVKACELVAGFELARRLIQDKPSRVMLSPREVWEELADIRSSKKEHFYVLFLDTQSTVLKKELVSVGTLNASLVHPREVFEPAIKHLASHIIVAHNHPSGGLEPSEEDLRVTKRLQDAGRLLGIDLLDHVIVTNKGFCSLKGHNLLG